MSAEIRTSETKSLLEQSLEHWKRMRTEAKKLPAEEYPAAHIMRRVCGQVWFTADCALCRVFYIQANINCPGCPLSEAGCNCDKEGSLWKRVHCSDTWREWIENADKLIAKLEEFYEEEKKSAKGQEANLR